MLSGRRTPVHAGSSGPQPPHGETRTELRAPGSALPGPQLWQPFAMWAVNQQMESRPSSLSLFRNRSQALRAPDRWRGVTFLPHWPRVCPSSQWHSASASHTTEDPTATEPGAGDGGLPAARSDTGRCTEQGRPLRGTPWALKHETDTRRACLSALPAGLGCQELRAGIGGGSDSHVHSRTNHDGSHVASGGGFGHTGCCARGPWRPPSARGTQAS